jgi:Ca2+-binding RTX toxin-like protein
MYAYQTKGNDTATLTGTTGNDRVSDSTAFVILSTGSFIQQAFNFSTVIVNAGTDLATLDDSTGNDTLNASGGLAEMSYGSGRKIQLNGFDTVTARGINGGVNRKHVTGTLAYVLRFTGTWV